jgi:hypothetical protein
MRGKERRIKERRGKARTGKERRGEEMRGKERKGKAASLYPDHNGQPPKIPSRDQSYHQQ